MLPRLLQQLLLPLLLPLAAAVEGPEGNRVLTPKTCPRSCDKAEGLADWSLIHDLSNLAICPEPVLLNFNLYNDFDDPETVTAIRACTLGDSSTRENYLAETDHVAPDAVASESEVESDPDSASPFSEPLSVAPPTLRARQAARSNETVTVVEGAMCGRDDAVKSEVDAVLSHWEDASMNGSAVAIIDAADSRSGVEAAISGLSSHIRSDTAEAACDKKVIFTYVRGTLAALYAGSLVDKSQTAASLLKKLAEAAAAADTSKSSFARQAVEVCGPNRTSTHSAGAIVDTSGDFSAVQKIVRGWNEGRCIAADSPDKVDRVRGLPFWGFDMAAQTGSDPALRLARRAECRSIRVKKDDTCTTLAERCGLGGRAFENFNKATPNFCGTLDAGQAVCCSSGDLPNTTPGPLPDGTCRSIRVAFGDECPELAVLCGLGGRAFEDLNKATPNFCGTLKPGQPVCCSSGKLPDITKDPQPDGTCAVYEVQPDEGCDVVTAKHGITEKQLYEFNKETWGWNGCALQVLQRVCVSRGNPPMPATYPDSQCGPTKPGSKRPTDGTKLVDMNPCPLSVCCNVWGNCGTTPEFCTISKTITGNPGTTKVGEHGCQSNCGMEYVRGNRPDTFAKIGYFEGWNQGRPCLHMDAQEIHPSYTHVHFAFGEISADLKPMIPDDQLTQFHRFRLNRQARHKKILAYGGWAFSNEGPQTGRFREAFQPKNRAAFADAVVEHAIINTLSGVDFDWEYPGARDIEGSEPGQDDDGENYFQFLKLLRSKLPDYMTLSIAAPASFWYLRGFSDRIKEMGEILDYIVYMTYDYHGQWDVGNKWSMEGKCLLDGSQSCPAGNCLRSHVNATLTTDALRMITWAGIPSHKVMAGVTSYGRSFKMTDAACRGPMCTFEGTRNNSPAKKGKCTQTGGYISNYEIDEIRKEQKGKPGFKEWYDADTDSDMMVYDRVEWVAFMNDDTKTKRMEKFRELHLGGTSDWAIDLQGGGTGGHNIEKAPEYTPNPEFDNPMPSCPDDPQTFAELESLDNSKGVPVGCGPMYIITILKVMLANARKRFDEIMSNDYDKYFEVFARFLVENHQDALADFTFQKGGEYFDCEVVSKYSCCGPCAAHEPGACDSCIDDEELCKPVQFDHELSRRWAKRKGPCPPDWSGRGFNKDRYKHESVFYKAKNGSAHDLMKDEIYAVVGIPQDKITFPEHSLMRWSDIHHTCWNTKNLENFAQDPWSALASNAPDHMSTCKRENWWHGAPRARGFAWEDAFNPKDDIEKALNDIAIDTPLTEIALQSMAYAVDIEGMRETDIVDALMVPIFMIEAGLEHMEEALKEGKKIDEMNTETLILHLLSGVFILFGAWGGVVAGAASAGWRTIGRVLVSVAELGHTGLGAYAAVQEPKSIPLLLFGLVMSGRAGFQAFHGRISEAARLRRQMTTEEIVTISKNGAAYVRIASKHNEMPPMMSGAC